jgi:uncharacterized protein
VLKFVVLVIVVLVVLFVLKSYLRGAEAKRGGGAQPGAANENMANTMVRCAQCGVHVPRSESIFSRSKFFCSDEHRLVHFK